MIGMQFDGGKELSDALAQLPQRTSRSVMREALLDASEPMRKEMGRRAPRRPPHPDMADNIVAVPARGEDLQEVAVLVGPAKPFFYATFIELGTAFMQALPFARPAFDAMKDKVLTLLGQNIWLALTAKGIWRKTTIKDGPVTGPGRTV